MSHLNANVNFSSSSSSSFDLDSHIVNDKLHELSELNKLSEKIMEYYKRYETNYKEKYENFKHMKILLKINNYHKYFDELERDIDSLKNDIKKLTIAEKIIDKTLLKPSIQYNKRYIQTLNSTHDHLNEFIIECDKIYNSLKTTPYLVEKKKNNPIVQKINMINDNIAVSKKAINHVLQIIVECKKIFNSARTSKLRLNSLLPVLKSRKNSKFSETEEEIISNVKKEHGVREIGDKGGKKSGRKTLKNKNKIEK
jgi:hypothetical protein